MNLTVITPTCHRPEAFALCEKYMAAQTVRPFQWIVLDDDETPTKCTAGQEYHYWPECRGRGSLVKKIRRALEQNLVRGDAIVFWENDDYYAPDYLEWCVANLKNHHVVGEGRALYYTVRGRYWFEHVNLQHASLCATSLTRAAFPWLLRQCTVSSEPFLDVRLWHRCPVSSRVADPYAEPGGRRSVGIKSMPGRNGYGGGHRGRDRSAVDDLQLTKLRSLIGDGADAYAPFYVAGETPQIPENNMHTHIARTEAGRVHGPNWLKWLSPLRGQNAVGLEVGTFEGDSAEWMLENIFTHGDARYHCVDSFEGSDEHKLLAARGQFGHELSQLEAKTRAKLARFPNAVIHKGFSQAVLRSMPDRVDFAYVDAGHSSRDVLRDGVLAFELLNVGGTMVFDDYPWAVMPNELDRPKTGIDAFLKAYGKHLRVIARGYQIALVKTSE